MQLDDELTAIRSSRQSVRKSSEEGNADLRSATNNESVRVGVASSSAGWVMESRDGELAMNEVLY